MKRTDLHRLTRRPAVIARFVAIIVAAGVIAGIVLSKMRSDETAQVGFATRKATEWLRQESAPDSEVELLRKLRALRTGESFEQLRDRILKMFNQGRPDPRDPKRFPRFDGEDAEPEENLPPELSSLAALFSPEALLAAQTLDPQRRRLFEDYIRATNGEGADRRQAEEAIFAAAAQSPPAPLALTMKGDVLKMQRLPAEAIEAYHAEAAAAPDSPAAEDARCQALLCGAVNHRGAQLRSLLDKPGYQAALQSLPLLKQNEIVLAAGDYAGVTRVQFAFIFRHIAKFPEMAAATLLCGIIWYLMLHQIAGLSVRRSWRSVLAVALGFLSPAATLFVLSLQEYHNTFEQSGDFLNDLLYFIAGVGLREELSKLLFFAPLLIFLRNRSEAEILVVAGCVGLGFAMEENISYFAGSAGLGIWSRFFTANFFHVALTALCGLALVRWVRHPRSCWEQSLLTILLMIVLHGLYDFMIYSPGIPETMHLGGFSLILFIYLSLRYLTTLRLVREPRGNLIGPEFVYLTGTAVLFSAALLLGTWTIGLSLSLEVLTRSVLELAVLTGMFVWQLRDL